jgi:hypothetical protein
MAEPCALTFATAKALNAARGQITDASSICVGKPAIFTSAKIVRVFLISKPLKGGFYYGIMPA